MFCLQVLQNNLRDGIECIISRLISTRMGDCVDCAALVWGGMMAAACYGVLESMWFVISVKTGFSKELHITAAAKKGDTKTMGAETKEMGVIMD